MFSVLPKPRKTPRPSPVGTTVSTMEKAGVAVTGTILGGAGAGAGEGASTDGGGSTQLYMQAFWLILWIANNIGITILNKAAFSELGFNFPCVTSAFHMLCNWLGTAVYFAISGVQRQEVRGTQWIPLVLFSVVFSLNIAVGNVSSMLVSVAFNQVMRSLVPAIVMAIGIHAFRKTYSMARKLAVIPIMIGVALACYGEMDINVVSFTVTAFCVLLAALKVLLSGEMLTGSMKMPPLHLLSRMAPLALVQTASIAFMTGEITGHDGILAKWDGLKTGLGPWAVLATGVASFSLNLTSLQANKVTSPLTLSIMANIKQVMLICFSTIMFNTPTTLLNAIGIFVVIIFSFRYSMLSIAESRRPPKPMETPESEGPLLPK